MINCCQVLLSISTCAAISWLHSKLGDTTECEATNMPGPQHRFRFAIPPTQRCDAAGLNAAYQTPMPFIRDGLLFVAKDGNYELGVSPLAMLWLGLTEDSFEFSYNYNSEKVPKSPGKFRISRNA